MGDSRIEWTDRVWNPTIGCIDASEGCRNCYAKYRANRNAAMGNPDYQGLTRKHGDGLVTWTGVVKEMDKRLDAPLHWRRSSRVFVDSMSDLFHPTVTDEFIVKVFAVMAAADRHQFQLLTKRPERMRDLLDPDCRGRWFRECVWNEAHRLMGEAITAFRWPLPNVWGGTSVEDQDQAQKRIHQVLKADLAVRFISAEPLLEGLDLERIHSWGLYVVPDGTLNALAGLATVAGDRRSYPYKKLDWVIVGGESGPRRRPFDPDWARSIRDQCQRAGVRFFYKQGGGPRPGMNRELDGRTWDEFPTDRKE